MSLTGRDRLSHRSTNLNRKAIAMYLLCIRGTTNAQDAETVRNTHNQTAGNDAGVAAARALGDLSHKVFVPCSEAGDFAGSKPGELLFLDIWREPSGIEKFFSDKQVQAGGAMMFKQRDAVVAMPATGAFTFALQAPMSKPGRYIGLIRGTVRNVNDAIAAISAGAKENLSKSRQRGQLSHELYVTMGPPSKDGSAEIIGVDLWADLGGMLETYQEHTPSLLPLFTERPAMSVWKQPAGAFVEW
jgi:hypothetical protein